MPNAWEESCLLYGCGIMDYTCETHKWVPHRGIILIGSVWIKLIFTETENTITK